MRRAYSTTSPSVAETYETKNFVIAYQTKEAPNTVADARREDIRKIADIIGPTEAQITEREIEHVLSRLHRAYTELGFTSRIRRGTYEPSTHPSEWHGKMRGSNGRTMHQWVECEGLIVDLARTRFGEQGHIIIPVGNRRYAFLSTKTVKKFVKRVRASTHYAQPR